MTKRHLTEAEIEELLSFIEPNFSIPNQTALSVATITYEGIASQLREELVYPEIIPQLALTIRKCYFNTQICAGDSVGIVVAQSVGEKQTQLTLNSFHKCGQNEKAITSGVPRFQELMNASQAPKNTSTKIYFVNNNSSIQELREHIGARLVEVRLEKIVKNVYLHQEKVERPWHTSFELLWGRRPIDTSSCACLTLELDVHVLYEYQLTMKMIADSIEKSYDDLRCVFSPTCFATIDIFVDISKIKIPPEKVLFITPENTIEVYIDEVVTPQLMNLIVSGIPKISFSYYSKEETPGPTKWYIETEGNNLREIFKIPGVDCSKTVSNNLWEIYSTLGIEATRTFLINEFLSIMEGLNICHANLLADRMTFSGIITSISRYTMRKDEAGPLCRASFEESMDNLLKAATNGEVEPTLGVSASIICGKRALIGTGMFDLMVDIDNLPGNPAQLEATIDEEFEESVDQPSVPSKCDFPVKEEGPKDILGPSGAILMGYNILEKHRPFL